MRSMRAARVLAMAAGAVGLCVLNVGSRAARAAPQQGPTFLYRPTTPLTFNSLQLAPPQTNNLGTFNVVIVPGAGLSGNAPALAAFQRAALAWSSLISDPITVTINADLATTDPQGDPFAASTIGSTTSVSLQGTFDVVRNAMVTDANAQAASLNNQIITSLPTAAQFTATLPAGRTLAGNIVLTKANAKALNFTGLDLPPASGGFGPSDGTINFNSNFGFDYDNSNGVSAGQIDFQTTATHEIGHLLGFSSAVDTIDTTTAAGAPTVSPTTLDLFRFGRLTNNPSTISQFTGNPRDLTPGDDTITDDLTTEYRMSTGVNGVNGGDGQQASHWKDNNLTGQYIGVMDPTLAFATVGPMTDADFRAVDLIGYDVQAVPEPAAAGLLAAAGGWLLARRRRQSGVLSS